MAVSADICANRAACYSKHNLQFATTGVAYLKEVTQWLVAVRDLRR